jgi:CRP/FNR family cyclic AMP-dependent transcriptional regulator
MERADLLASISLFEGLIPEDLRELSTHLSERRYRAGEIVFNQGDHGDAMFIVAEGQLNIFLPGEASRRISLKDIGRGEFFGELALFDDQPRSASVLATTEAVVLELDRATLSTYLEQRPRAAMAILKMITARLRETNALLSARAAKNAVAEVEANLNWRDRLADRVASLNGSWSFIIALLLLTCAWTLINTPRVEQPFDPYPYVFFNLLLAILVALQGPLIVMSQNRQALKDRKSAESDFQVNLKNEVNIETILRELGEFRAETNSRLEALERA